MALLEQKILIVLLARNYDWELPPQVRLMNYLGNCEGLDNPAIRRRK